MNAVDLRIRKMATESALLALGCDGALVLVDVEGAEDDILTDAAATHLRRSTVVIELHEEQRPGVTERIAARFASTHAVELVGVAARDPSHYPAVATMDGDDGPALLGEGRPPTQRWMHLRPLTGQRGAGR